MKDCCGLDLENKNVHEGQAKILKIVFAINLCMFFVEITMGIIGHSTALLSDSLDMFGDALVYGISLYVLHGSDRSKARVALIKGVLICLAGVSIFVEASHKMLSDIVPSAQIMGWMGLAALIANTASLLLITKYRRGDLNMRSAYICSRNDIISNVGVLIAGGLVYLTRSKWPDIIVGLIIATWFFRSSWPIFRDSIRALRA